MTVKSSERRGVSDEKAAATRTLTESGTQCSTLTRTVESLQQRVAWLEQQLMQQLERMRQEKVEDDEQPGA